MSTIIRGYKFRIYPTEDQAKQIDQLIHISRYVYNWGIAKEREAYESYNQGLNKKKFYSFIDLCNMFKEERDQNPDKFWLNNINVGTARSILKRVVLAYKMFFKNINNIPHFKSKKNCSMSFDTRKDTFKVKNNSIKIEGIDTLISLGFNSGIYINENWKCKTNTIKPCISKDNLGNYYVSFSLKEESKYLDIPKSEGIGIDLGIRRTFTLSNGEIYTQPKEKLDRLENRHKIIQRHVTRDINRRLSESMHTKTKYEDIPKSKRAIKRELKLNKIYKKIHNIKNTFYHTITKQIVMRNPEYICMETFSVREIERTEKYMSKNLVKVSFYDITQKMKYKCNMYNIPFIQVPKDFASTQICSNCGHQKKMYSNHIYRCPVCGMVEDRDINAAINLKEYGYNVLNNIGIVYY